MAMLTIKDVLETTQMITQNNLDVRTITMGISLRDCCHPDIKVCANKIYDKITKKAVKGAGAAKTVAKAVTKTATKTVKKAAKKDIKIKAFVEYYGKQVEEKDIIARVKKAWTRSGKKVGDIKEMDLYIKPEENAVYYVINGTETGAVEFE